MTRCPLTCLRSSLSKRGASHSLQSSFCVTTWCVTPLPQYLKPWCHLFIFLLWSDREGRLLHIAYFSPVCPIDNCQCWDTSYSSFGFWTHPCNKLVLYLLIRDPEISAQLLCIKIKIPIPLHFNRNNFYLLKYILKYPHMNESIAIKHYIR